jgi:hypothetical protein
MRVAILSRQTLHTEVMGLFIPLLHEFGHTISLFYNTMDPWHMIDYYRTRYPYIEETCDCSVAFQRLNEYDRIILITSDEWNFRRYKRYIQEFNNQGKLIVTHHDLCYLPRYPHFRRYVGLMPCYGLDHMMFPLYEKPALGEIYVSNNLECNPTLVCVGSLDSKDQVDVGKYIHAGGNVANYVRYPATSLLETYSSESFECVANLSGSDLMKALVSRIGCGRGHMWFPIKQDSVYATIKFSGSLTLGVDIGSVLVMPDVLRVSIGLPSDAVITYTESVTEPVTMAALRESMRDPRPWLYALHAWKCEQWSNNMRLMATLLE